MIDANRVIGLIVYSDEIQKAKSTLVEMAFGFIENDICQINGETCYGDGEAVGRIMNMPSLKKTEFEQCLKETIGDLIEIETNAPKFAIVFSDILNEKHFFLLHQLHRQCSAKRADITFLVVDDTHEYSFSEEGCSIKTVDAIERIMETINANRVSV